MKTSELIGPALDWAVAKCEGYFETTSKNGLAVGLLESSWVWVALHPNAWRRRDYSPFKPSTDWAQGGPIIEREKITVSSLYAQVASPIKEYQLAEWGAYIPFGVKSVGMQSSPTPLIAAMRCYCCAKLGDEIEIPQELQPCQQPNL